MTRVRLRRLIARSVLLSRWHYRAHGLELAGRAGDTVWYFAYGSNMHDSVFRERRHMRPREWRVGHIDGYRLRFNLHGVPRGRSAPANICPDPRGQVWGVLYRITLREMVRLNATEGIPGGAYRPTRLMVEDDHGQMIAAMTYVATGDATDGQPSLRYITLLREGARAHGLPAAWVERLDRVLPVN
ncbi:MAG TPA: gamma-glutamylcyclotransferase family protein [Stellaceae bacterium]|nr:gamma-glutamylcyclotransferase family protein [Stellaceae bacterium]